MAKAEYRSAVRSRTLITEALAQLLIHKPLDRITVTDVVRQADVNRGTFYAHFSDIPDLTHFMIEQTFSHISQAVFDQGLKVEQIPHVLLAKIQEILEENPVLYQKIMLSNSSYMMEQQLVNMVLDYLFRHEAQFNQGSHEEYMMTIRFCAGGLSNLYREWFAGRIPLTLTELTAQAEQLLRKIILASNLNSLSVPGDLEISGK